MFAWIVALVGLVVLGIAFFLERSLLAPYQGWSGDHVDVELTQGLSAQAMLERLGTAGVLRDPTLVRRWLELRGGSGTLQAGEYRFDRPIAPAEVLERLRRGEVLLHGVTIPEGLVLEEIARRLADAGLSSYDELLAAFRDPTIVRDLDPEAADLEGYLYPETYRFARNTSAARIAETLVERFRQVTGDDYATRADAVGLDLRQAVILASMIEEETSLPEERRPIARVFLNRLRLGMPMQCDPTVLYAWHRAGRSVGRLLRVHLKLESPWNTYVVRGLPVGPIASPGRASLEAAVDPGVGRELYFVAAPGGGHRFSTTHVGHLAAVAEWRSYSSSSR